MKTPSHWRHMYNKEKQWIISFTHVKILTYLAIWKPGRGGGGASIIRLGQSWFTSTLYLIKMYMSNIDLIRTFWVKIRNMKKNHFYIKSRDTRGTKMSANADLITVETYVQQGETIWKPAFIYLFFWHQFCFLMLEIAWNAKKTWNIEKNKFKILFLFNIEKIHKKFKQHSINIKNYTAHPHDMVHIPAKFRENTSNAFLSYSAKTKRDRRTDGQTDRRTGGVAISPVPGLRRRGR